MEWDYNIMHYSVYYQKLNNRSRKWEYDQKVFYSEVKAKKFAAEILKDYPNNGIIIKSKEYKILFENGNLVKKYIGKEHFIVKPTTESHNKLLKEVSSIHQR